MRLLSESDVVGLHFLLTHILKFLDGKNIGSINDPTNLTFPQDIHQDPSLSLSCSIRDNLLSFLDLLESSSHSFASDSSSCLDLVSHDSLLNSRLILSILDAFSQPDPHPSLTCNSPENTFHDLILTLPNDDVYVSDSDEYLETCSDSFLSEEPSLETASPQDSQHSSKSDSIDLSQDISSRDRDLEAMLVEFEAFYLRTTDFQADLFNRFNTDLESTKAELGDASQSLEYYRNILNHQSRIIDQYQSTLRASLDMLFTFLK